MLAMETKSKYLNLRLTPTQHEALKRLAYDQRSTMTDVLARHIEKQAKRHKLWPK